MIHFNTLFGAGGTLMACVAFLGYLYWKEANDKLKK